MTQPVVVSVGEAYDVRIGQGVLADLRDLVQGRRVMVVHQRGRADLLEQVLAAVAEHGGSAHAVEVPDAEAAKDLAVLGSLWSSLGRAGFTRDDLVIGLGGGATTDLAGFAAATWLRGVDVVHLPTSLLGVVDAAVGGKTGINTAEGKNLVGAFHPPVAVLCDPAWLATMTRADYASGLAEVVKAGFIADPVILDLVEADPAAALDPSRPVAVELIARAVQVKAEVVTADLRESSLREILNYGHTFGHAVEQVSGYTWRHGDAVAVGMVYVAELALALGLCDGALVQRHRSVLASLGLPTSYPGVPSDWPALRQAMARDKKARGSGLRFVALEGLARPVRVESPPEPVLEQTFARLVSPDGGDPVHRGGH